MTTPTHTAPPAADIDAFPHLVELLSDADRCPDTYRRVFALTPNGDLILTDLR